MTKNLMIRYMLTGVCAGAAVACSGPRPAAQQALPPAEIITLVDSARVLSDLQFLSSSALEGRRTGSEGNDAARAYIESELMQANVDVLGDGWSHPFEVGSGGETILGENVLGVVRGTTRPGRYIVVSAHYDHLGRSADEIYHGADDNASGTAALLEIARQLALEPPRNSVIFAALDAEEMGLRGARAFIEDPVVSLDSIVLNVNMDMVSRNEADEIYVAGTYHYPFLNEYVDSVAIASDLRVLRGHDRPDLPPGDDWTMASDHGPFHSVGIPFAYFGVEDHADYHQPTDTFERIDPGFFIEAVRTILAFVREVDAAADEIVEATR